MHSSLVTLHPSPFTATGKVAYDNHGNLQSLPNVTAFTWDFMDRVKEADLGGGGTACYTYNAEGQRIRKVIHNNSDIKIKETIYLDGYEVYHEFVTGTVDFERETVHIMDDQTMIAMAETKTVENGNPVATPVTRLRYQISDHLGSGSIELSETGAIISFEEYYPYGGTSYHSTSSTSEVSAKRYRYNGKEKDEETNLYYYGARCYISWLGRWMSADPIGEEGSGLNLYRYASNNPVTRVDPTGMADHEVSTYNAPPMLVSGRSDTEYEPDTDVSMSVEDRCTQNPESCQSIDPNIKKEEDLSKEVSLSEEQIKAVRKEAYSKHGDCYLSATTGAIKGAKAGDIEDTLPGGYTLSDPWISWKDSKDKSKLTESRNQADKFLSTDMPIVPSKGKQMVEYATEAIKSGRPVVVGVQYATGTGYNEGVTDHYVVLTGYKTDKRGNVTDFSYIDNIDTKETHTFDVDMKTGRMSDKEAPLGKKGYAVSIMNVWKNFSLNNKR